MDLQTRKRVGVLARLALIGLTIALVIGWMARRVPDAPEHVSVTREAPAASTLGPGDLQIISTDGNVDLILQGDKIMGGLSPATVAKVRDKMAQPPGKEGFGAMIEGVVKSSVASAIGTHVTYPIREVTELRFDDGKLIIKTKTGGDKENNFGNIKIDKDESREPARFSKEDGERFIAAFNARKKELGIP